MLIKGIEINVNGVNNISEKEIVSYIDRIENESAKRLKSLSITDGGNGNIALDYKLRPAKFERIRRITGYLVGTTDRFNNAKRAEEHDRVKHGLN